VLGEVMLVVVSGDSDCECWFYIVAMDFPKATGDEMDLVLGDQ
jgi:hypothetical protein